MGKYAEITIATAFVTPGGRPRGGSLSHVRRPGAHGEALVVAGYLAEEGVLEEEVRCWY